MEIRLERKTGSRSTWVLLSLVKDFGSILRPTGSGVGHGGEMGDMAGLFRKTYSSCKVNKLEESTWLQGGQSGGCRVRWVPLGSPLAYEMGLVWTSCTSLWGEFHKAAQQGLSDGLYWGK